MEHAQVQALSSPQSILRAAFGVPLLVVLMLAMMVLPMPPFVLDLLFTFNIAISMVVLLAVVYAGRPLDFAVFPTVLLMTTLLRLALNVASTRVVLLHGHTGTDAAGKVIEAFGAFVVGGNYAVGLVVFTILVIINFVVVTKGAGRVSEVSARFTLDAMPGKQMAIDADLNAGIITQDEARTRRQEVGREADFYGAMDGASKFVRGDAVAGILILFINIIGGLAIGVAQHGMPFGSAFENYTLLTIGDGLVAQIPALVLSTAAAILVTRASHSQDMGSQIKSQLFDDPRSLAVTAGVLGTLGLIPGMPNLAFLLLAAAAGSAAWTLKQRRARTGQNVPAPVVAPPPSTEPRELSWDDVGAPDVIGLEVGYRLVPLVDKGQGGSLMARIKGVRRKLSQDLGFLVPAVHIRDNLELPPNGYRVTVLGNVVGEAEVHPDREMAINPGRVHGHLSGLPARDPAFDLEALWIEHRDRETAQTLGYTVVDTSTVIATHLSELVKSHAQVILGREEVQAMMNQLSKQAPKLVEDLTPKLLPLGVVTKVLQNLLEDRVPVRDLRTVAESLAVHANQSQDPAVLTGHARIALGRAIVQHINGIAKELPVITLDPSLEQILQQSVGAAGGGGLEPGLVERMRNALADAVRRQEALSQPAILLTGVALRPWLARFARHSLPGLRVLAYDEVPDDKNVRIVASIGR